MVFKRAGYFALAGLCVVAAGAWAQAKHTGEVVEGQIRRAAFNYYSGLVFGEAETYLKGTRMPLWTMRDGAGAYKDEKASRATLAGLAEKLKGAKLSDEDRSQIVKNLIQTFDAADIQFIGANTAALTFLIRHDEKTGDSLCTVVMHRADPKTDTWKVITEVTDSTPVPPEYTK